MLRNLFFSAITVLFCTTLFAQESNLNSPLGKFSSVKISGRMSVTLVKAEENSLSAVMTNVNPQKFEFMIKDEVLHLKLKPVPNSSDYSAAITLKYIDVSSLTVDGAILGNEGTLEQSMLNVSISAGATVSLNVKIDDVSVEATGNSKISLNGQAEVFTARATMGGKINAVALDCLYGNVSTNTKGECYVWATRRLEAKAATSSNIYHKGKADIMKLNATTLGNILEIKDAN